MNSVTKAKKENLFWMDPESGEKYNAGVAFYISDFGEYRLILDAPRTVLYLRPKSATEDRIDFVVHSPVDINGKFSHRVQVGSGYASSETNGQVYMKIGRYLPQRLVLVTEDEAA